MTAPTLRTALRVLADAAGRVLADGSEASRDVRLELFARLASAEEYARDALDAPVVDDYAIRFASAPPPTSAEWNALVEDRRRLRRELDDVTAAAAELKPARPVVESVADAVRVVEDVIDATSVRNASLGLVTTERTGPAIVEALVGDPVLTQHDDGTVTISWPNDTAIACLVPRSVIEGVVAEVSELRRIFVTVRNTLAGAP